MSFLKAILHGKEKRKNYRGSKVFDYSCRNHGSCDYCKNNRLFSTFKLRDKANREIKEWFKE